MLTRNSKQAQSLSCRLLRSSSPLTLTSARNASSAPPDEADVVIIGGGAIGTSTLYHLSTMGVNAILLEKDQITAGTTWHSAGLLWRLRPNDTEIKLIDRTRELVRTDGILEQETGTPFPAHSHPLHTPLHSAMQCSPSTLMSTCCLGQTCGWNSNGGLFIASNRERMDEYKRLHTIGKFFDIESSVLSPAETKELYPLMNVDDVYGTLYSPGDGTVEPAEYVTTLSKAAKKRGARIFENCHVDSLDTATTTSGQRTVRGVLLQSGQHIKAKKVIICGGVWSRDFAAKNDANVPLCAMKHAYVLTDSIPGIRTMPCVRLVPIAHTVSVTLTHSP